MVHILFMLLACLILFHSLEVIVIAHKWTLESLAFADWTGNGRAANNETAVFDARVVTAGLNLNKTVSIVSLTEFQWTKAGPAEQQESNPLVRGANTGRLGVMEETRYARHILLTPRSRSCKRSGLACMSSAKHNDRSSKAGLNVPLERNFHDRDRQSVTEGGNSRDITEPSALEVGIETAQPERITYEIGLVSVTAGQDLRYVGPSSGYSFAKLLFAKISRRNATRGQNGLIWLRIALQATSFALDRVHYLLLSRMLFNYLKTIGIMCNTNTHSSTNQAT
ncbi:uncharacterized protein RSE6_14014 [Rhynchosporium secalis]|uniref:Uncharacterized protein n=1 Tax=Rhynchosporium secalis TaxID=38038 RepID=A0A1E1MU96_RHYSE|nr:uncharacterized protein RSE6_14014 [Rhynchosporium secalis]